MTSKVFEYQTEFSPFLYVAQTRKFFMFKSESPA